MIKKMAFITSDWFTKSKKKSGPISQRLVNRALQHRYHILSVVSTCLSEHATSNSPQRKRCPISQQSFFYWEIDFTFFTHLQSWKSQAKGLRVKPVNRRKTKSRLRGSTRVVVSSKLFSIVLSSHEGGEAKLMPITGRPTSSKLVMCQLPQLVVLHTRTIASMKTS